MFIIMGIYSMLMAGGLAVLGVRVWRTRGRNGYATRDDDPRPSWEDQK